MKTILTFVSVLASLSIAQAQSFTASLDGAQDGGGARQGIGSVNLTLSGTDLSLTGSYSGLSAAASAGHIHGPGAVGVNVGVIYNLASLGILTLGTAGTYNGTVHLGPIGAYTVAQQITDLDNSLWYLNLHDANFPGGEIRGQIVPVPEPSSLALLGLGAGSLLWWMRRRTK